jgi:hypothetical protein
MHVYVEHFRSTLEIMLEWARITPSSLWLMDLSSLRNMDQTGKRLESLVTVSNWVSGEYQICDYQYFFFPGKRLPIWETAWEPKQLQSKENREVPLAAWTQEGESRENLWARIGVGSCRRDCWGRLLVYCNVFLFFLFTTNSWQNFLECKSSTARWKQVQFHFQFQLCPSVACFRDIAL